MANGKAMNTPIFRVSFPQLFEPKAYQNGPREWSVVMLFPKDADLKELKAEMLRLRQEAWPNLTDWKGIRIPFKSGTQKEHLAGYGPDVVYAKASLKDTQPPPAIVDRQVRPIPPNEQHRVYAGCYAIANISPWTWDNTNGKGISFNLHMLQFVKHGEPFGAGKAADPETAFANLGADPDEQAAEAARPPANQQAAPQPQPAASGSFDDFMS
jgi:hypothetical protein